MTTLIEKLKAASLEARKNHNGELAASLTTLLSEAMMIGKNDGNRETDDAEVIAVIKKTIKNIDETLTALTAKASSDSDPRIEKLSSERVTLESFLPKQLSINELKVTMQDIIEELSLSMKQMGVLMKTVRERFEGQYNGSEAARLAKELLK